MPADFPPTAIARMSARSTVDLSQLALTTDATYQARSTSGSIEVTVPEDAQVVVQLSRRRWQGRRLRPAVANGTELNGDDPRPADRRGPGEPTLTLDLAVDVGTMQVRR